MQYVDARLPLTIVLLIDIGMAQLMPRNACVVLLDRLSATVLNRNTFALPAGVTVRPPVVEVLAPFATNSEFVMSIAAVMIAPPVLFPETVQRLIFSVPPRTFAPTPELSISDT